MSMTTTHVMRSDGGFLRVLKRRKKLFKLCLCGDGAVGKTTFLNYLKSKKLVHEQKDARRTTYVNIDVFNLDGRQLQLFDLAGQRTMGAHPLDHMSHVVLKEVDIVLFFFALDKPKSLRGI